MRRTPILLAVVALALGLAACKPAPVPTRPGTARIVLFGDSIPARLIQDRSAGVDPSRYTLVDGTLSACEPALPFLDARSRSGKVLAVGAGCTGGWRKLYPPHLTIRPDVAIVMPGTHAMLDHRIDGVWTHPCQAAARTWYLSDLLARLRYLRANAARVVLVLPAWPGPISGWVMPDDHVRRATCVREVMAQAAATRHVPTVDLGAYLCPTGPTACTAYRTADGIHIDPAKAPTVLRWLLREATEAAAGSA